MNRRSVGRLLLAASLTAGLALSAAADPAPHDPPTFDVSLDIDSGYVRADGPAGEPQVVFAEEIRVENASWLRLKFDEIELAGHPATETATILRITSLEDGAQQRLNAEHARQWNNTSAYFNGDAVLVEVVAYPGVGESRIVIDIAKAGEPDDIVGRSICDGIDERELSSDPRAARLISPGCSAWLFDDANNQLASAGHCGVGGNTVVQFNAPVSNSNGSLRHPPAEDQYTVDTSSNHSGCCGTGNDWRYFGAWPNSNTGLTPAQAQGEWYETSFAPQAHSSLSIRVTGYGTTSSPVHPSYNRAQKTHVGPYTSRSGARLRYRPDTTGGNSGSPVILENTGRVIGVHTHGGCNATGGANNGTALQHPAWQDAINNPTGINRSGAAEVESELFFAGDLNNNFGMLDTDSGVFGRIDRAGSRVSGLAYDPHEDVFYMSTLDRELYSVDPDTAEKSFIGTFSVGARMHGLAFDAVGRQLYGMNQGSGVLFRIDTEDARSFWIGSPMGGEFSGIEFHAATGELYAIDNDNNRATLVKIDPATGQHEVIGDLGSGIRDCHGLGYNPADESLYTVSAETGNLYRINEQTGQATSVGSTHASLGSSFGMAGMIEAPECIADWNGDGEVDVNDFFAYLEDFEDGEPRADLNNDGEIDINDFFLFLQEFEAGC